MTRKSEAKTENIQVNLQIQSKKKTSTNLKDEIILYYQEHYQKLLKDTETVTKNYERGRYGKEVVALAVVRTETTKMKTQNAGDRPG